MDINFEHRLTEVEERTKSNSHRLDDLERRQDNLDELVGTVKELVVRQQNTEAYIMEIKNDVKTLTNKPAQRWDGLVNTILTAIVATLIGFMFAQIGM